MPASSQSARRLAIVLTLLLAQAACAPAGPRTPAPTLLPVGDSLSQASPLPALSAPAATERRATLNELANDVQARESAAAQMRAARLGDQLRVGGQVRTGSESQVRLDLSEGTIVRLGADTEFTLTELSAGGSDPFTRLTLLAGQVWVILSGGRFEVETPAGVASVRGSYLGVTFDPAQGTLTVTCLEGQCGLRNDQGEVALTNGQTSRVLVPAQPPSVPAPMAQSQVQAWVQFNPEAAPLVPQVFPAGTPTAGPVEPLFAPAGPGSAAVTPRATTGGIPGTPAADQPLRYQITNFCSADVTIQYAGPESGEFSLTPGASRSGELPPGQYTFTSASTEPRGNGSITASSAQGLLVDGPCSDGPGSGPGPGPTPGPGQAPPPGGHVNTQPLRYSLNHNCPADPLTGAVREGTWVWTFQNQDNGQTYTVSVAPGENKSGELPPGHYLVSDQDATGPLASGLADSDFSQITVTRCPNP